MKATNTRVENETTHTNQRKLTKHPKLENEALNYIFTSLRNSRLGQFRNIGVDLLVQAKIPLLTDHLVTNA